MRIFLLASCALTLAIPGAAAQTVNEKISNDHELYAAYCAGALAARVQKFSKKEIQELDRQAKELWPDGPQAANHADDTERSLSRYRSYLIARGFFSPGTRTLEAKQGVIIAAERGKADEKECYDSIAQCKPSCDLKTGANPLAALECGMKCLEEASHSKSCAMVDRCLSSDPLPF